MPGYGYGIAEVLTSNPASGGGAPPFEYTAIDNNYSMTLDGIDNYVDLGLTGSGTNDVSLSFWMKTSESVAYNDSRVPFGSRPSAGGSNYTLGRIRSQFATPTELNVTLFNTFGSTVLNDGNWHHLVYTFDYTSKEAKAYVDGNTTPEATFTFPSYISNFILRIGQDQNGGWSFNGNVDECAYWNTILSEETIEKIYNTTNDNPGKVADLSETPEGVPIAWYTFE